MIRWFGAGQSALSDPAAAGAAAAEAAFAGREPVLALVFCSVGYHVPAMLDEVRSRVGPATVIVGCTTSGQMATGEAAGYGVAVVALGGEGFSARARVAREVTPRLRAAGAEIAGCLAGIDRPHRALLVICDGLTGNQHELVRGAFSVVGAAAPLVGGCAGDDLTYDRTYQFHGGRDGVEIMTDAGIGIALGSDAPLGIGIAHGWRKQGAAMVVTSSRDGRVFELDGEPALDVLLRRLGLDESVLDDEETFRERVFLHPLGMSRRTGEDIRVIHGGDRADRSLLCLADVPQGALTWLMETDHDALVDGARDSAAQALDGLGGQSAIGLLAFDCVGRRTVLGDDGLRQEMAAIGKELGGVPYGGFYTNGEIARVRGALGMHHFTLVTLALA
ncbi:FIST signal transduction protein [Actinoplanes subtropicus]|uniref:FIST signal transduction protein n=1 Tax=Actinoplanes subtropicus TaxID=543632 RepID=UPI0004C371F5|nr:FIST N-terminal domain-containing protein [Actinoplanes subtropicus]